MLESLSKPLEVLFGKISRKAAITALAMTFIYLICIASSVNYGILCIGIITGLALIFTFLQFFLDKKTNKEKDREER